MLFTKRYNKKYNFIINRKNCYDKAIDCDIQRYKWVRKLTIGKGKDYTTGCLLDYDRLIAFDLSRQKELDSDPNANEQIELVGQLKNVDGINSNRAESIFLLTILEKIKETILKFSQGSVTVI